jgi:hypothetical protein
LVLIAGSDQSVSPLAGQAATVCGLVRGFTLTASSLPTGHHDERGDAKQNYQQCSDAKRAFSRAVQVARELDGAIVLGPANMV